MDNQLKVRIEQSIVEALIHEVQRQEYINNGMTPSERSARVVEWDILKGVIFREKNFEKEVS